MDAAEKMVVVAFEGDHDDFAELAKELIADNLEMQGPHDDPRPAMLILHPVSDEAGLIVLPDFWFADREAKYALGRQVIEPTCAEGARLMAVLSMAWLTEADTPAGQEIARRQEAGELIPSLDTLGLEGVKEEVTVLAMSPDRATVHTAQVHRTLNDPPTLSPWEDFEGIASHWYEAALAGWRARGMA